METSARRGLRARLVEEVYIYCAFWIAVSALPALALSYVVVRMSKQLWLRFLSSRYPRLEFIRTDTVRSLLDTHRNQGIINVLLSINGPLNPQQIKDHLIQHILERRDRAGGFMFPRLRHQLVSCWGNYAWDSRTPIQIENHFIVASGVYRGRPVSDQNIQEYVSEIVSKYFPTDQPPWQYIIIPYVSVEPKYYVLVRVHHLLLSGSKSINIGDLLLVEQLKTSGMVTATEYSQQSPLVKLLPAPSAIPELVEKMNEIFTNAWNEFVSEYDPVESPRALKSMPGAFHVAGLLLMSTVSAFRGLTKKKYTDNESITTKSLLSSIQKECKRRDLTIPKTVLSPLVTIDPRKWPKLALNTAITATRTIIKFPFWIQDEIAALRELKNTGQVLYPKTMTWKYASLAQLAVRASMEAWRGMLEIYQAPFKLWSDTIRSDDGHRHVLQTMSLCGRKVTAWSKPVSRSSVDRAARALGVSATDISLFAATEALRAYFEQTSHHAPDIVLTTARAATEDFLFTFAEGDGKMYKKSLTGGMVCLSLPIGASPRRISSVVGAACERQVALAAAWAAQARYGALTRSVPSPFARLTLNLLSRRYAVSYAEINAPPAAPPRHMMWGQPLEAVLYWRPPQANISMSLTVIQYADTIRLAVMSDSRLTPGHAIPAHRWSLAIERLVAKVDQEIARISAQASLEVPRPIEDQDKLARGPSSRSLKPPAQDLSTPPPTRRVVE